MTTTTSNILDTKTLARNRTTAVLPQVSFTKDVWERSNFIVDVPNILLLESDTGRLKYSDGISPYKALRYINDGTITDDIRNRLTNSNKADGYVYLGPDGKIDVDFIPTDFKGTSIQIFSNYAALRRASEATKRNPVIVVDATDDPQGRVISGGAYYAWFDKDGQPRNEVQHFDFMGATIPAQSRCTVSVADATRPIEVTADMGSTLQATVNHLNAAFQAAGVTTITATLSGNNILLTWSDYSCNALAHMTYGVTNFLTTVTATKDVIGFDGGETEDWNIIAEFMEPDATLGDYFKYKGRNANSISSIEDDTPPTETDDPATKYKKLSYASQTKLDGIEAGSDKTTATNVNAAGAVMYTHTVQVAPIDAAALQQLHAAGAY